MKNKLIAFTLILSLSLTLPLVPSVAAVKAGSSCKTAGLTSVATGKTFTCIKSGKKLVWDSGMVVSKSMPTTKVPKLLVAGGPCSVVGESKSNSLGYLECREIANNQKKYFQLKNMISDLPPQNSPMPFTTCRVPDFRTNIGPWDYATAYPIKRVAIDKKNLNVIYIPIDFPDHPGTGNPKDLYSNDFTKIKEWVKWYSNGKKSIDITTFDKWIRSSKPSADYVKYFYHGSSNMSVGVEMILKDVENLTDLSKIDVIQFVFPSDMQTLQEPSGGHYEIMTNKGRLFFAMYTTGVQSFSGNKSIWFDLLHELLHHAWGIQQHAPAFPVMLNISTGTPGPGQSLLSWDAMTLDWDNNEDLWCADLKTLSSSEVTLVPIEREQKGVRAAMINLAPSRTLVIESHRKDKWGNYNPGTYGLTAYVVDTRFATDRSGEGSGKDDGKGTAYTRAANFIEFPLNHSSYKMEWWDNKTGKSYGITSQFSMNYFLYEGESFTFEGVTVKLIHSGDNDTIEIRKN